MTVETDADQFAAVARRYAEVYSMRHPEKGLGQIFKERALNLTLKLYQATKKIAPTQAQIAADVQKQGWKIPATFPDGRTGRGTPDQWVGAAVAALPKQQRRGRKSRARTAQEAAILGSKPTLQQMQAFVIRLRSGHAGFIATGWLGALHDLGGKSGAKAYGFQRVMSAKVPYRGYAFGGGRFGRAELRGVDEIDIINDAPGCVEANAKHNFVAKGTADATADMAFYIADRIQKELKLAA